MNHTFAHFEIPADDLERAGKFYRTVFDWQIEPATGYEGYQVVRTGTEGHHLDGALMARQQPGQPPVCYVEVESVADYLARVEKAGGRVVMPRSPVAGMGWFGLFLDPEGNVFGLWQTDPSAA